MLSAVNSSLSQTSNLISSNKIILKMKEGIDTRPDNKIFIDSKTGEPLKAANRDIYSDEDIRSLAHCFLMGSFDAAGETRAQYCNLISNIMDNASIENLKNFINKSHMGSLEFLPKATKELLDETNLDSEDGKNFLESVSQSCARRLAEIVEDEGTLARLSFLSNEEKQDCINESKKSSNEYIKYLQNIILKYYEF